MKFKYLFLIAFSIFLFSAKPAKALDAHCLCLDKCIPSSYTKADNSDPDFVKATNDCKAAPCSSPYPLYQGKCEPFVGHCECKSGCVEKPYSNANEVKSGNDYCASDICGATDKVFKEGSCPAKTAPTKKDPEIVSLTNPLEVKGSVVEIIGILIKGVLGIMGGLVLLMVVWGGSTWLLAAGNPEKVKAGSQTILWALLGAIITAASYLILNGIMKMF